MALYNVLHQFGIPTNTIMKTTQGLSAERCYKTNGQNTWLLVTLAQGPGSELAQKTRRYELVR